MPTPITGEHVKAHLGITHGDDDLRLAEIAARVVAEVQGYCRRSFSGITEDEVVYCDGGMAAFHLPLLPVVEVTEILNTRTGEAYDLDLVRVEPTTGLVFLESGRNWHGKHGDNRWKVTFDHGYAECPADVRGVMLTYASALYERPDTSIRQVNEGGQSAGYVDPWEIARAALSHYRRLAV